MRLLGSVKFVLSIGFLTCVTIALSGCGALSTNGYKSTLGVAAVTPANGTTGVAITSTVTAAFNMDVTSSTLTTATFTLTPQGGAAVTGTISYNSANFTATFTPSGHLAYSKTYTATITTGVQSTTGTALTSNYSWSFTTAAAPGPTVTSVTPTNGSTGVAISTTVTATFSEAMDASTLNTSTFTLAPAGGSAVTATVTYSGNVATLTPSGSLTNNTVYTATITTGAQSSLGSALAANYTWSFTTVSASLATSINHIIFIAQENRSFDHYFGALRQYWAQNGYPDRSFDGLPQFNPTTGAAPLVGPAPKNPGCNANQPPPADCAFDTSNPVTSYHLVTQCIENPSPAWNEGHVDWDYYDPTGQSAATLNGFVYSAAHDARNYDPPYFDTDGRRAMGYYDGTDLNYYYWMASNFGTSDRFFNPTMTRTQSNREYLVAGTSGGYVYPEGTDANDTAQLSQTTIFQALQNAGISWKIYVDPTNSGCTGPPYQASCLMQLSYMQNFTFASTIVSQYPNNIAPVSQYFADLQNGTLPQVAQFEPASDAGLDEHPGVDDAYPSDIQLGAQYVESLVNGLMQSPYWKSSVFILTFDENGGLYDHVAPQPAVSPDGIKPVDLLPGDICTTSSGPTCDFVYTGYRVPLLVISPFAKKNYVDHTVADTTAILKLIETRFGLPALTKRDAAQPDMTEFFNFASPPWMTPPSPPAQATNGACYVNQTP
ncbi:MAG TPA: alkaline phosphatase family protein [Terracidiphilus sp.]|nr:alkaline phosphatase family protein [Terracidiphilus sp.]